MKRLIYLLLITMLVLVSCTSNDNDINKAPNGMQELEIPDGFDFSSEQNVDLYINIQNYNTAPVAGIVFDIAYVNSDNENMHIMQAVTNETGIIERQLIVPSYVNKLFVSGLMSSQELEIINGEARYEMGPGQGFRSDANYEPPAATRSFSYLPGVTYNSQGVPSPIDLIAIEPEVIARISTSLPEHEDVGTTHPEYIADGVESNFVIIEDADVWITFVAEGASYRNAFGFYTYPVGNPPADPASLDHTILFPNCSYPGYGGALESGSKIYLGTFTAGTVIGWFLVQNGWEGSANVSETAQRFYSDKQYNPEGAPDDEHTVLLYDAEHELFVLGFEDVNRQESFCDHDFNDAVFIANANPLSGIDNTNIPPIDVPPDTDGDGVSDPIDEFPNDPDRAFTQYYPSTEYATVVFEDLWPHYGDYDLNDLVIDFRYQIVTNAAGLMKDIDVLGRLRAVGASNNNGLSIEFPFTYSDVTITGYSDNLTPALVEDNYTILDLFSNTTSLTGQPVPAAYNTNMDLPTHAPIEFYCNMTLASHLDLSALDFLLPFNIFMIQQGDVSHEIHLINHSPTGRADLNLFGTHDDASVPSLDSYYLSITNLPWALNMPESWHYPAEQNSIIEVYDQFAGWAESGGISNQEWYLFQSDRVDMDKVYIDH
ncbi:MAG: LruC domain-containing protein [Candidatus Stygibacter australis]|nr:LruC domain-containing protein [Candidatus Stygibacter australis]MDP8323084.1 LruC domain-containing protein [Candidatus Stygibacter australis]